MKIVHLWSGGVDSSTMIYYLITKYQPEEMYLLSFNYGQKHTKEVEYSMRHFQELKKRFPTSPVFIYRQVDITSIQDLITKGSLMDKKEKIPYSLPADESQKSTIVPNRNMILLSIATGYAIKVGAQKVTYAAHLNDYPVFPDCRKEFVKALDTAIYLGNLWDKVELEAPFTDLTKDQIVAIGLKLGVPYELTWSCYEGWERPCLSCGACLDRLEAFLKNNAKDPLLTDEEWKKALEIYERMKKKE
jgi:7-cyano-7-deazaguanine synthase